jgi:hypothetical protein
MTGLAYAENYADRTQPAASRWVAMCILAAVIHLVPMLWFTLPHVPLQEESTVINIDFSDSVADLTETPKKIEAAPKENAVAPKAIAPPVIEVPPPAVQAPQVAAAQPTAPKAVPTPPPKIEAPKPEAAPFPAPAPVPSADAKPALREPDVEPLIRKDIAAFDESKTTKEIPTEGYLSDRNSTAADRGPKNLPRGDPFMDKGQSRNVRYMEKRGEGNLPAIASAAGSGSVKKEGNPDAGKGFVDERPADQKRPPKSAVAPDEVDVKVKPQEKTAVVKAPELKPDALPLTSALRPDEIKEEKAPEKKIGRELSKDGVEPLATNTEPAKPKPQAVLNLDAKNVRPAFVEKTNAPETVRPDESAHVAAVEKPRRNKEADELAAFAALIDGKGKTAGRGGDAGDKAGIAARAGSKGHEGDGTLRPGHDEAVSDVTTINLESSAEEFDDARFAKKFDAKTAYVKPLARRIDGKWKAEIQARNRYRLVVGAVAMKVVVRRDGTLLEATEIGPRQPGVTDECVTVAKKAIEIASSPKNDPFPSDLASRETLEFVFTFLYH